MLFRSNYPQERRLLHIVSDFRSVDWTGAKADALHQALEHIKATKVDVHLIDTLRCTLNSRRQSAAVHMSSGRTNPGTFAPSMSIWLGISSKNKHGTSIAWLTTTD